MFIRHLFDHMLLTIVPETLTSLRAAFDLKTSQIVDYSHPEGGLVKRVAVRESSR